MKRIGRLCIITDTDVQKRFSHSQLAEMAVKGGADIIQFREKNMSTAEMIDTAASIEKICRRYNALLIINDRVDVAMIVDADGVHLGEEDLEVKDARKLLGKTKIIGRTAHSLKEAKRAAQDNANYIGYGHIFTTHSKLKFTVPKGIEELTNVCKAVKIPVLGIGGIDDSNIKSVIDAGAHGVAVIGAVAKSKNPFWLSENSNFASLSICCEIFMKCVLTIAGSDSSAGAGIQSDLKTFRNHGLYGLTVITAVTSQNTFGVQSSQGLPAKVVRSQLKSLFDDFSIKTAKTGMLSSGEVIRTVAKFLKNKNLKLIIDPVITSKNNFQLLSNEGISELAVNLLPLSYLCTPNFYEAEIISGIKIKNLNALEKAANIIYSLGCLNVLIKGGHFPVQFDLAQGTDVLYNGRKFSIFTSKYVNTKHTHGIGCTFSAAITANLALGKSLKESIVSAKTYVIKSLNQSKRIGRGFSPVEQ